MLSAIAFGTWAGFQFSMMPICCFIHRNRGMLQLQQQAPSSHFWHRAETLVDAFGRNHLPYIVINIAVWILLAWQTWQLSRFLFKDETAAAVLSALVILSPILVKTHYTTITTLLPDNLPVSICFAALLFSLRNDVEHRLIQLIFIGALVFVASSISEYGVAAAASSIGVLLIFQKRRTAFVILLGAIFGYILAQSIGDFD